MYRRKKIAQIIKEIPSYCLCFKIIAGDDDIRAHVTDTIIDLIIQGLEFDS